MPANRASLKVPQYRCNRTGGIAQLRLHTRNGAGNRRFLEMRYRRLLTVVTLLSTSVDAPRSLNAQPLLRVTRTHICESCRVVAKRVATLRDRTGNASMSGLPRAAVSDGKSIWLSTYQALPEIRKYGLDGVEQSRSSEARTSGLA